MSPLLIVGTGDHARVVAELARSAGMEIAGFVEPGPELRHARLGGHPVLGLLRDPKPWLQSTDRYEFVVAVGNNRVRAELYSHCLSLDLAPRGLVHPSATLLGGARIGAGAQVLAGSVIGVDASVGANAIVNTLASVDHDNDIGEHATIAPGVHLAGRVVVEIGAHVGLGAVVREGLRIGSWSVVGAGAAVVRSVPPGVVVVGVPARPRPDPGGDATS